MILIWSIWFSQALTYCKLAELCNTSSQVFYSLVHHHTHRKSVLLPGFEQQVSRLQHRHANHYTTAAYTTQHSYNASTKVHWIGNGNGNRQWQSSELEDGIQAHSSASLSLSSTFLRYAFGCINGSISDTGTVEVDHYLSTVHNGSCVEHQCNSTRVNTETNNNNHRNIFHNSSLINCSCCP